MTTISDIAEFIGTTTDNITSIWGDQIEHLTMNSVKTGNGTKRKYTRSAFTIWKEAMGDKLDGKTRGVIQNMWSGIDQTVYKTLSSFEKETLFLNSSKKVAVKKVAVKKKPAVKKKAEVKKKPAVKKKAAVKKKDKCCYGSNCSDYDSDCSDCSDYDSDCSDCSDCSDYDSDCSDSDCSDCDSDFTDYCD